MDKRPAQMEFELAWQEYFKEKPKPKTDEESKKELEEFTHWYNCIRKQTDTGKTPDEMYKEIYGEEPPKGIVLDSRIMNFEWDENYDEELFGLIEELKEYDNNKGYKLSYEAVKEKLEPVIKKIIEKGETALDGLHGILENEETWSCLFALEILKEIKNDISISALIEFIKNNEDRDYWERCEKAMIALTAIGIPAIEPLMNETKKQFKEKIFSFYITGALTEIKDEKVYNFMKEVTEDYIKDEEKYNEWFHIDVFIHDFEKQGKKEILHLLENLSEMDRISKHERIEIEDTIKIIKDPIKYEKELKEETERMKPVIEEIMKTKSEGEKKINQKELDERMHTTEEGLEIQFKCCDCNKKQNIDPGIITSSGNKKTDLSFENEIMCKFCFSNNIKLTEDGYRDIMFQAIGTYNCNRVGVVFAGDKVSVENKTMLFEKTYDYILKRLEEEPENGELYLRAGNVARRFNKYNEAIKYYEKAIELNPRLIAVYVNLVEIYEFRYLFYKIKEARSSAVFYLNEMMDLFRAQDFDILTLRDDKEIVQFIGEKSELIGVNFPDLVKLPMQNKRKIGRNELCPCGSGKKYKKCCLGKEKNEQ